MRKLLFVFPIIALLAAGCGASKQVGNQTPVDQNATTVPVATKQASAIFLPTTVLDTSKWKICTLESAHVTYRYPADWIIYATPCNALNPPDKIAQNQQVGTFNVLDDSSNNFYNQLVSDTNYTLVASSSKSQLFYRKYKEASGESYFLVFPDKSGIIEFLNKGNDLGLSTSRQKDIHIIFENIVASLKF